MNRDKVLLEEFIVNHSTEAARLLEQMSFEQVFSFINKISAELVIALFQEMDVYLAYKCLEEFEVDKAVKIINTLPISISASLLRSMDKTKREKILEKSEQNIYRLLAQMLYHAEDTVGALVNPQVIIIHANISVKEAFERVKKSKHQSLNYLYVTDTEGKLSGLVRLEDLVASASNEKIIDVMNSEFPYLYSEVEVKNIADHPGWLEHDALPVLDRSGVFLGAINQKEIKRFELEKTKKIPRQAIMAGNALGELFKIGLIGLLNSAFTTNKQTN